MFFSRICFTFNTLFALLGLVLFRLRFDFVGFFFWFCVRVPLCDTLYIMFFLRFLNKTESVLHSTHFSLFYIQHISQISHWFVQFFRKFDFVVFVLFCVRVSLWHIMCNIFSRFQNKSARARVCVAVCLCVLECLNRKTRCAEHEMK